MSAVIHEYSLTKVKVTINYQVCTVSGTHEKVLRFDISVQERLGVNEFDPVDLAKQKSKQDCRL